MRATKESCADAIRRLDRVRKTAGHEDEPGTLLLALVAEFLTTALRRLPTAAADERDRQHRRDTRTRS